MRRRGRRFAALRRASAGGALGGLLLCVAPAEANGPIASNGTPITTSRYAIDLFRGPVFAGSRVTGLSGAYVAIGLFETLIGLSRRLRRSEREPSEDPLNSGL